MNYSIIVFIAGWVIKVEALFMLLPGIVSLIYREKEGRVFFLCALVFFVIGKLLTLKKPENSRFYAREGFVAVAMSWIILSIIGAIPFVISGEIPSGIDALFEIVSGFTTTGASILTDVESLSRSMLFWRSFSHWIGGMGVLVFILAVLPMAGGQNIYLIKAESTGPDVGKFVPKIQKTAGYLYIIYIFLSALQLFLLILGKMPLFDALCDVFGSAGTGGFGIKADSMAGYSTYIQIVTAVFMLLFGVNFNFYFLIIAKRIRIALGMEEVKWYFIIYFAAAAGIALNLWHTTGILGINIKDSLFQVSSIMTSTGYATVDFDKWPQFSRCIICIIMFIGACTGSTGGGIKVARFIIYFKEIGKQLGFLVHPRSVKILRMNGKKIDHNTIRVVNTYLLVYIVIFAGSMLLLTLDNFDLTTTFTAVSATFNNIGPGLGDVGPAGNFSEFSVLSKIVMIFDMLAGRLEIFPLLVLFTPATWRRNG
ncbi:MAG: TrkH family potassium uptake protein [Clostridia bacterium]|nr:TrkH family potassium uptake protein [Clostridia bacterium]